MLWIIGKIDFWNRANVIRLSNSPTPFVRAAWLARVAIIMIAGCAVRAACGFFL
jgi:hypothetical protein